MYVKVVIAQNGADLSCIKLDINVLQKHINLQCELKNSQLNIMFFSIPLIDNCTLISDLDD